jgi:hypothetical protein
VVLFHEQGHSLRQVSNCVVLKTKAAVTKKNPAYLSLQGTLDILGANVPVTDFLFQKGLSP